MIRMAPTILTHHGNRNHSNLRQYSSTLRKLAWHARESGTLPFCEHLTIERATNLNTSVLDAVVVNLDHAHVAT